MKKRNPIFKVVTMNQNDLNKNTEEEIPSQFIVPTNNKAKINPKKAKQLFQTAQLTTCITTFYTPLSTSPQTSIWKEFKPYVEMSEIIILIKKGIFFSLILYINNLLNMMGINENLLQIYDELINNLEKKFNKDLSNKSLCKIFTSIKIKNASKDDINHNKDLIKKIYEKNFAPLVVLLNKTFLEVLMHFRRSIFLPELKGFEYYFFLSIKNLEEQQKDKNYIDYYIDVLNNYEYIFDSNKKKQFIAFLV